MLEFQGSARLIQVLPDKVRQSPRSGVLEVAKKYVAARTGHPIVAIGSPAIKGVPFPARRQPREGHRLSLKDPLTGEAPKAR